jgi:hypothetical protein
LKDQTVSPSDESRIQDYLAGRLDAADAERFEERMMAEDALANEVHRALEIRAATSPAAVKTHSRPASRTWLALAAAAGVAVLGVGIVWLQRPADAPVFRGAEQRMQLEVESAGTALRARWQAVGGAAGYELQVLASDGRVLRSVEAEGTTVELDLGGAAAKTSEPAFVEVSALDGLGQTLQRSERVALPNR